jgi:hypothetical protein
VVSVVGECIASWTADVPKLARSQDRLRPGVVMSKILGSQELPKTASCGLDTYIMAFLGLTYQK